MRAGRQILTIGGAIAALCVVASLPLRDVGPDVPTADEILLRRTPAGELEVWYGPTRGTRERWALDPDPGLPVDAGPEQRQRRGVDRAIQRILTAQRRPGRGSTVPRKLRYECNPDEWMVPSWALVRRVARTARLPWVVLSSRGREQGVDLLELPMVGNEDGVSLFVPDIPLRLLGDTADDLRLLFMRHPGDQGGAPRNRLLGMNPDGTPLNLDWVREQVDSARATDGDEQSWVVTVEIHALSQVRTRTVIDLLDAMGARSELGLQLLVSPRPIPRNYFPAELVTR